MSSPLVGHITGWCGLPEPPFIHLNLRRNPFGEMTLEERVQLGVVNIHEALEHLKKPRACVQVMGEKGFGKTTHLLAIVGRLPHSSYVYLPEGQRHRFSIAGDPLIIDEAQRLTFVQRWRVMRSRHRLVLGTHEDHTKALLLARRPVLTLAADRLTDPERIRSILNRRIESVRRGPGLVPSLSLATASQLHARFGSDVRSMEHVLYEVFQHLRMIQDV